jgi:hypothetical protein
MAIKVVNNLKLRLRVDQIFSGLATELKTQLSDIATEVDRRTQSGKDVNERAFTEYRPATKKMKIKTGRNPSPVNLTQTGKMLASFGKIKILETNRKIVGTIGFNSSNMAKIAGYNQDGDARRNRPPRKFVGLSPDQKSRLLVKFGRALKVK